MEVIEFKRIPVKDVPDIIGNRLQHISQNNAHRLGKLFLETAGYDNIRPTMQHPETYGKFFLFEGKGLHRSYKPDTEGYGLTNVIELVRIPNSYLYTPMRLHIGSDPCRPTSTTTQLVLYDSLKAEPKFQGDIEKLILPLKTTERRVEFQDIDDPLNSTRNRVSMHIFPESTGVDMDTEFGLWLSVVVIPTYGRMLRELELFRLPYEPLIDILTQFPV